MFSTSIIAVALATLLSANAQTYYTTDPNDIGLGTKQIWCSNQMSACTLLCLDQQSGGGFTNDCDPETLSYNCICSDNTIPNATQYSQTIPYFLCTYSIENCVQNCGQSDPTCSQLCKTGKTCGASNPTRVKTTSGASTSTKKPTKTGVAGDDDEAFDAEPTESSSSGSSQNEGDDAPAATDGSSTEETDVPNAGNRFAAVAGSTMAFSVMILSVACGAFVFQL